MYLSDSKLSKIDKNAAEKHQEEIFFKGIFQIVLDKILLSIIFLDFSSLLLGCKGGYGRFPYWWNSFKIVLTFFSNFFIELCLLLLCNGVHWCYAWETSLHSDRSVHPRPSAFEERSMCYKNISPNDDSKVIIFLESLKITIVGRKRRKKWVLHVSHRSVKDVMRNRFENHWYVIILLSLTSKLNFPQQKFHSNYRFFNLHFQNLMYFTRVEVSMRRNWNNVTKILRLRQCYWYRTTNFHLKMIMNRTGRLPLTL